jgi:hypothetical protein
MRVRDHIAISTAGAALLRPLLGRRVRAFWAGSVLIDVDHYAWYVVRQRDTSPVEAIRFFGQAHAPEQRATRSLHSVPALVAALILGLVRRPLLPVTLGMGFHVALDRGHATRLGDARTAALERDGFACCKCGARGSGVETHLHGQPWLLPSYRPRNLTSLCRSCHEGVHRWT